MLAFCEGGPIGVEHSVQHAYATGTICVNGDRFIPGEVLEGDVDGREFSPVVGEGAASPARVDADVSTIAFHDDHGCSNGGGAIFQFDLAAICVHLVACVGDAQVLARECGRQVIGFVAGGDLPLVLGQWAQGLREGNVGDSLLAGSGGGLAEGGNVGEDVCGGKDILQGC